MIRTYIECQARVAISAPSRFAAIPTEMLCGCKKAWILGTAWTCECLCANGLCDKGFVI